MNRKIFFLIAIYSFFGCSATQHFVPNRLLGKGGTEFSATVGISTSNFSRVSIQGNFFWGVSDRDAIGTTLNWGVLPGSITYVRYWNIDRLSGNAQFHLNDILGANYNPTVEADLAFTKFNNPIEHSLKFGIGYYATPLMFLLAGNRVTGSEIVPIIGYNFQNSSFQFEISMIYGLSDYFIRYYKNGYRVYSEDNDSDSNAKTQPPKHHYQHEEVGEIIQDGINYFKASWKIALVSGDTLLLTERDPYVDCIACYTESKNRSAYTASEFHRVLWLYSKNYLIASQSPVLLELDMKKIIRDYNNGEALLLAEETDLTLRTLRRVRSGFEDVFFSAGYRKREK